MKKPPTIYEQIKESMPDQIIDKQKLQNCFNFYNTQNQDIFDNDDSIIAEKSDINLIENKLKISNKIEKSKNLYIPDFLKIKNIYIKNNGDIIKLKYHHDYKIKNNNYIIFNKKYINKKIGIVYKKIIDINISDSISANNREKLKKLYELTIINKNNKELKKYLNEIKNTNLRYFKENINKIFAKELNTGAGNGNGRSTGVQITIKDYIKNYLYDQVYNKNISKKEINNIIQFYIKKCNSYTFWSSDLKKADQIEKEFKEYISYKTLTSFRLKNFLKRNTITILTLLSSIIIPIILA